MWRKYREHTPEILAGLLFSALLMFALLAPVVSAVNLMERVEMAIYDLRLRLGETFEPAQRDTAPPIVIVDIDDATQMQEGSWPWPRGRVAALIERIAAQNPATIALHSLFGATEPLKPGNAHGARLPTEGDNKLAAIINRYDVVLGFLFTNETPNGELPTYRKKVASNFIREAEFGGHSSSVSIIQQAAKAVGFINLTRAERDSPYKERYENEVVRRLPYRLDKEDYLYFPDSDGLIRHYPLFMNNKDTLYASFALATAQRYWLEENEGWNIQTEQMGAQRIYTGIATPKLEVQDNKPGETAPRPVQKNFFVHTDAFGQILIPFSNIPAFKKISASQILQDKPSNPPLLEGDIVLVAPSGPLQGNDQPTPFSPKTSAIELHAQALFGLFHPEILLYEPVWGLGAVLAGIILLTLIMLVLYPLCGPVRLFSLGILLLVAVFGVNDWFWRVKHIRLDMVPLLLLVMVVSSLFVLSRLFRENHDKQQLQSLFGQYVPPQRIQQMIDNPGNISFAGEKRIMSVLFADLHDFTELAERLDIQTLKKLLNHYLSAATDIIFQQQGTIDKYIGDMIMAFWNAPLNEPRHAQLAVLSALGLRRMLQERAAEFRDFGITPLQLGIGVNTGEMNVGDMGSSYRRAYTVLGDSVNLAARMESLTRFYGVDILVSETTRAHCEGILFRTVDRVRVKGKRESVILFHPVGQTDQLGQKAQQIWVWHEQAMRHYWKQDWEQAAKLFAQIHMECPDDSLAGIYLQRISQLERSSPAKDWQGIYAHSCK